MANRIKGEVPVNIDGKVWILAIDFNALCAFEEASGIKPTVFIEDVERGNDVSFIALRQFIHAMLIDRQPHATLADAGNILSSDPEALNRALAAAFPDPEAAPPEKTQAATA